MRKTYFYLYDFNFNKIKKINFFFQKKILDIKK